jgi:phospholipid/cholesterol/gamma-HCH transport system substrate-binding protein
MNKTTQLELVVGAFVLAGIIAVAYLALRIGAGAITGSDTYALQARFNNISGLNAGANVVIAGVTVGRVEAVHLDANYVAIVDLRVRKDVKLPADTMASIKTSGLIGDKYLALAPGGDTEDLAPGAVITETESAVDIESLISRFAFGNVQSAKDPAPAK